MLVEPVKQPWVVEEPLGGSYSMLYDLFEFKPVADAEIVVDATLQDAEIVCAVILYGPTNGPPPPTGGEPAGCMEFVAVLAIARARLTRPFPV